tara:strand:- start:1096 stop:1545 length:450 start_codon:yes stop_codon:yes gene_type:complete
MKKETLINLIEIILNDKISSLKKDINSLKESQKNDTKSSMGDKYETGRAMIQLELEKYHSRLSNNNEMLSNLLKINPKLKTKTIQSGSLIQTNHGWFFISIGIGKVKVENNTEVIVLSPIAPLGRMFLNKVRNESFDFQNRQYQIIEAH